MPSNPPLPLPKHWPRRVRSVVLHAVALARGGGPLGPGVGGNRLLKSPGRPPPSGRNPASLPPSSSVSHRCLLPGPPRDPAAGGALPPVRLRNPARVSLRRTGPEALGAAAGRAPPVRAVRGGDEPHPHEEGKPKTLLLCVRHRPAASHSLPHHS